MHLIMAVRPGRFAGAAHPADDLAAFDGLADTGFDPHHVSIKSFVTITMADHHIVTVTIAHIAGNCYRTVSSTIDRGSLWRCKVKPRMHFNRFINRVDPL